MKTIILAIILAALAAAQSTPPGGGKPLRISVDDVTYSSAPQLYLVPGTGITYSMSCAGGKCSLTINSAGSADQTTTINLWDDFIGGINSTGTIGALGWNVYTTGGGYAQGPVSANANGVARIGTGASNGNAGALVLGYAGSCFSSDSTFDLKMRIALTQTATFDVWIGFLSNMGVDPPNNNIAFEKLAADTNWYASAKNGSNQTRVDTGVAASTNYAWFRIRRSGTTLYYSINGGTESSITTNISANLVQFGILLRTREAVAKTADVDAFGGTITVTR